jgi:hypothetical protein
MDLNLRPSWKLSMKKMNDVDKISVDTTPRMSLDGGMSKKEHLTTPEIERIARRVGANDAQIINWRYRGVPALWRGIIVKHSRQKIKAEDFPEKAR